MAIDQIELIRFIKTDEEIKRFRRSLKSGDHIRMVDNSAMTRWVNGLLSTEKLLEQIKFNNGMRANALTDLEKFKKWLSFIGWEKEDN